MSNVIIRSLLEVRLNSVKGVDLALSLPNKGFSPALDEPWGDVDFLFAKTANPTMGDGFKRALGLLQVMLHYPLNKGAGAAVAKADALCTGFQRGTSMEQGAVQVKIMEAPWQVDLGASDVWFRIAVNVPFIADVQG